MAYAEESHFVFGPALDLNTFIFFSLINMPHTPTVYLDSWGCGVE